MEAETLNAWAICELLGHVRMAGRVSEEQRFGATVGRLDVPTDDGFHTIYFGARQPLPAITGLGGCGPSGSDTQ